MTRIRNAGFVLTSRLSLAFASDYLTSPHTFPEPPKTALLGKRAPQRGVQPGLCVQGRCCGPSGAGSAATASIPVLPQPARTHPDTACGFSKKHLPKMWEAGGPVRM